MAHIDVSPTAYLLVEGDAAPSGREPCDCWATGRRGVYGQIAFAGQGSTYSGRAVAEICLRAINEAVRGGALPPEGEER